ncbi:hypothetical protein, partial [Sulfurihydrogenibium azorense]|uniref:hypothetical protein n=1 Tax=Sulfurihydrogenibium azorense TaxID=309806 RepID=UPI00391B9958
MEVKMAVFNIVKLSELEGALRLDAEYYKPEYLKIEKLLQKLPLKVLKEIAYITDGSHEVREYQREGVLFLRSQDISEVGLQVQEPVYISIEEDRKLTRSKPKRNDILTVKTGNVGVSLVVDENFPDCNLPADIALIKIKNNFFNPFFVATYLNSTYGRNLIFREMTGLSRPRVVIETIKSLKIPQFDLKVQQEIEKIVRESYKQKIVSESLYSQAENLLLEELGLKDFKPQYKKTYTAKLSEAFSSRRIDAKYFQPEYEKLINKIKSKTKIQILKEVAMVKRGSLIDPKFYNEAQGIPYIRGKDFSSGHLEKTDLVYISKDFKSQRETRVKTGDIVFASIGSVGTG